jgi:hypothetical protein
VYRAKANKNKDILRQALGQDLPDAVRDRTGKGSTGTRVVWAFSHESSQIDRLLDKPLLRELDCVSATRLRREVERARVGAARQMPLLLATLSLEWWLRVRFTQSDSSKDFTTTLRDDCQGNRRASPMALTQHNKSPKEL